MIIVGDVEMVEPLELLIRILLNGGRVVYGDFEYAMAEDGALCAIMHDENANERLIEVDCDLRTLKKLADDIGRDKLLLMCCGPQLKKHELGHNSGCGHIRNR